MGQISVEKSASPGSDFSGNQQPEVQTALERLRAAGLVVRLDRGRYAADDASLPVWHAIRFPRQLGGPSSGDVSRS